MGQLAVGVHAVHYVCGAEPCQRAQHLCRCGDGVCVTGRRDLSVGDLQVPSGPATFPFQRWGGNGYDAGCCVHLTGATEADRQGKEEAKQTDHSRGSKNQVIDTGQHLRISADVSTEGQYISTYQVYRHKRSEPYKTALP